MACACVAGIGATGATTVVGLWTGGAITHGVRSLGGSGTTVNQPGVVSIQAEVHNAGLVGEQLADFTVNHPGVQVTSARFEPLTIPPGADGRLDFTATVDCAQSPGIEDDGITTHQC